MTITNDPWSSGSAASSQYAEMYQTNNAIATTINTINVWEEVGNLSSGLLYGWTYSSGALVAGASAAGVYQLVGSVSSSAVSVNKDFEYAISVEDATEAKSTTKRRFSTSDTGSQSISCLLLIAAGDSVKLEVRNITDATNITVIDCNICLKK